MKVDKTLGIKEVDSGPTARAIADSGYDAAWVGETQHDAFLTLTIAALAAPELTLGTAIAVAFSRSPMTLAVSANDLQTLTKGKFLLGLGTQVKAHIERRFSMPWSHPAPRMREYVLALRAIWGAWNGDGKLNFEGEFYRHTLMTPFFNPGPNPYGPPPVFIAGVGAIMTEVAGEVADGFLCHGFTTERYIREVTIPAIARGAAKAGRDVSEIQLLGGPFIVTGTNEENTKDASASVRSQIAFYASTPAYRAVLELHGWGDLQTDLNLLTKQNRWSEMGDLITDEILDAFAIVAEPDKVADALLARYGPLLSRVSFYTPYQTDEGFWAPITAAVRAG